MATPLYSIDFGISIKFYIGAVHKRRHHFFEIFDPPSPPCLQTFTFDRPPPKNVVYFWHSPPPHRNFFFTDFHFLFASLFIFRLLFLRPQLYTFTEKTHHTILQMETLTFLLNYQYYFFRQSRNLPPMKL